MFQRFQVRWLEARLHIEWNVWMRVRGAATNTPEHFLKLVLNLVLDVRHNILLSIEKGDDIFDAELSSVAKCFEKGQPYFINGCQRWPLKVWDFFVEGRIPILNDYLEENARPGRY